MGASSYFPLWMNNSGRVAVVLDRRVPVLGAFSARDPKINRELLPKFKIPHLS